MVPAGKGFLEFAFSLLELVPVKVNLSQVVQCFEIFGGQGSAALAQSLGGMLEVILCLFEPVGGDECSGQLRFGDESVGVFGTKGVTGVPAEWVSMQPDILLTGNSSGTVVLEFTPNATAELGDYGFQVTASYGFGNSNFISLGSDKVQETLVVAGQAGVPSYLNAHDVVASITPSQATAGQGDSASYSVQLINTGSADDTFSLAAAGLPPGVSASFGQTTIDVPPGVSNFRDDSLTLNVAAGIAPGTYPFTVTATSTNDSSASTMTSGTLVVVAGGVQVTLNPPSGAPGSGFQMTVTNTGTTSDTFKLQLGGPAALVASLATNDLTLAAGASQVVPISTGAVNFAVQGNLGLMGMATSQTNPNIQNAATAALAIPGTLGMTASFNPTSQPLPSPGPASFLLTVQNTGNTEDAYTATIIGTSGPFTASLVGLDGSPTQIDPDLQATRPVDRGDPGADRPHGTWHRDGDRSVTSLDHGSITSTVVATVTAASQGPLPTDGPVVTLLQRFGIHRMPTTLVLSFNQPLDPTRAQDAHEYQLIGPEGRIDPITSAVYDPATMTVTLHPKRRVNLHKPYKLIVDGAGQVGLMNTHGLFLNSKASGQPGSNTVAKVDWHNLVWPDPRRKSLVRARPVKAPLTHRPAQAETST